MRKSLLATIAIVFPLIGFSQTAVNETITYLEPDGIHATVYKNTRWGGSNLWMLLKKGQTVEKDFMYHNPYKFEERAYNDEYNKVTFDANNYALLKMDSLDVEVSSDEIYTFKSDRKDISKERFYGFTFIPDGYKLFTYAWILPDNFEFIDYKCNQEGNWQLQQNTLVYYGEKVNNLIFSIRYQPVVKIPKQVDNRQVNYTQTLDLASPDIVIKVWDDNKEDGDIISLQVNNEWVLKNFILENKPSKFGYRLKKGDNYLMLHAVNLGKMPPNTAALSIHDGIKEHKLTLSSNFKESEAILLRFNFTDKSTPEQMSKK
ncbi:MAG: hypothetical protein ACI8P3_003045 [Saprospiraceae bacterium]|jgi:hypothetical protein